MRVSFTTAKGLPDCVTAPLGASLMRRNSTLVCVFRETRRSPLGSQVWNEWLHSPGRLHQSALRSRRAPPYSAGAWCKAETRGCSLRAAQRVRWLAPGVGRRERFRSLVLYGELL